MKTWYVTTVSPGDSGKYDVQLAVKLQALEAAGHTIFTITSVSGGISIISYVP
jgi:hypothetical protein